MALGADRNVSTLEVGIDTPDPVVSGGVVGRIRIEPGDLVDQAVGSGLEHPKAAGVVGGIEIAVLPVVVVVVRTQAVVAQRSDERDVVQVGNVEGLGTEFFFYFGMRRCISTYGCLPKPLAQIVL